MAPFRTRNKKDGYVGLGKLLDSIVRFAAHTQYQRLLELKTKIAAEIKKLHDQSRRNLRDCLSHPFFGRINPARRRFVIWGCNGTGNLQLRIPSFCHEATIDLPGENKRDKVNAGDWTVLKRVWKSGDQIVLNLPLQLRLVKGRRAQVGRVAVMYGPLVFCLNRKKHEPLKDLDLRLLTIDPQTLEGPLPDDSVHPGGVACRVKAWSPGAWYPHAQPSYTLTFTEFPDLDGEAIYFHVPNPNEERFCNDELIVPQAAR